ncbi:MAG: response regulator, partial [Rhodospirillales bacterium]|nr:response regulator [Acetobacter sp.]
NLRFSNEYKLAPLKTANGRAPHSAVSIVIKPDGEWFGTVCVMSTVARVFSEQDVAFLQTVASMLTSIISSRRAHQALHAAKEEAEKANHAKSEFLSRVSHELRTPLNAILGFGQLLEMNDLDRLSKESTGHILRAGRHLLNLIDEVLQISRIETGQLGISLEPVNLREVLEECRQFTRRLAEQHKVRWECCDVEANCFVRADRQRLLQVFLNLVSNAAKYNREGGQINIFYREVDSRPMLMTADPGQAGTVRWLRVEVRDTGWGLDSQAIKQLFQPFIRLKTHDSQIEGTGLGLSLSKALIGAMQGHIGVESTPGVGSTFWVELPMTAAPSILPADSNDLAASTEEGIKPQRLLYIEDNLSNLALIECILARRGGIQLTSAMYGRLGLEIAREQRPDLILLDVHLPDLPGWEVLAALQADPATHDIPVVVISADATSRQMQRLTEAGAAVYMTKPIDVSKLMRVLDECFTLIPTRDR